MMTITLTKDQDNRLNSGERIPVKMNGNSQLLFKRGRNLRWLHHFRHIAQRKVNATTVVYICDDKKAEQNNRRTLWPDQLEAVAAAEALKIGERGRIYSPTGTGKTVIAEEIIRNLTNRKTGSITVVFAPRLTLLAQWAIDIAKYLVKNTGIPIAIIPVHSGPVSKTAKRTLLEAHRLILESGKEKGLGPPPVPDPATQPIKISDNINEVLEREYHVVILCTYHSSSRLKDGLAIRNVKCDLCIYDEAHYLVPRKATKKETKFRDSLNILSNRGLFFTATPRDQDAFDGRGMNNESVFGERIFARTPRDMIKKGVIVGPLIHQVVVNRKALEALCDFRKCPACGNDIPDTTADGGSCQNCGYVFIGTIQVGSKDYNSKMWLIYRAWQKHRKVIKRVSAKPDRIGAKMLVVCDGQDTLIKCFESDAKSELDTRLRNFPNREPHMYGLSSDFGVYNGEWHRPKKKGSLVSGKFKCELLEEFQELDPVDDAIIWHVNMISEGLDVPGITGVLFLRSCEMESFLQNEGRSDRLHPEDKIAIYGTKELDPTNADHNGYIKPNCYVILPWCVEWTGPDFLKHFQNIVNGLRKYYDIDDITTRVITDFINVESEEDPTDEAGKYIKAQMQNRLRAVIKDYCHKIEKSDAVENGNDAKSQVSKISDDQVDAFISAIAGKGLLKRTVYVD